MRAQTRFMHIPNAWTSSSPAEPTDAGVIPPEYKTSFANNSSSSLESSPASQQHMRQDVPPPRPTEKKPHEWTTNPVEEWAKEQVDS